MDSLKSEKVAIFIAFQGREFQVTESKYLVEFAPKYSVLSFGTTKSDFERSCADLLFMTTNIFIYV